MKTEETNERTQWSMGTLASLSGRLFPTQEVVVGRLKRWGYDIVSQSVDGDLVSIKFCESEKLRNTPLDQHPRISLYIGDDGHDYETAEALKQANETYVKTHFPKIESNTERFQ